MRAEYGVYKYEHFRTNLNSLRKVIAAHRERMLNDCAFYGHDLGLVPQFRNNDNPEQAWHQSEAFKLLKEDITDGAHLGVRPAFLWISRPEYLEFPLEVFRNHIYQEIHKREAVAFRFDKKKFRFNFHQEQS